MSFCGNFFEAICNDSLFFIVQTYQKMHKIFYLQIIRIACILISRFRESLLVVLGISAGIPKM